MRCTRTLTLFPYCTQNAMHYNLNTSSIVYIKELNVNVTHLFPMYMACIWFSAWVYGYMEPVRFPVVRG